MSDLDLKQLRSFTDVAELGSFSAAADKAGLTQPAISLQLRQLERQLGVRLIERVGRRAQPTAAGRDLLVHARRIQDEVRLALDTVAPHRSGTLGRLRIGSGATACIHLLPPVLSRIRKTMPGVEITVQTGNTADILRLLEANTLDAAVVTLPASGRSLDIREVYRDELVALFPGEEQIGKAAMTPAFLSEKPLILYEGGNTRKLIDQWFANSGQVARPVMELGSVEAIKQLVGAGLGFAIVPKLAVEGSSLSQTLRSIPLSPPLTRKLGLVLRRDKHMSRPLRALAAALQTEKAEPET
jgi:DNA-binding transcriptional LysR family regulator